MTDHFNQDDIKRFLQRAIWWAESRNIDWRQDKEFMEMWNAENSKG